MSHELARFIRRTRRHRIPLDEINMSLTRRLAYEGINARWRAISWDGWPDITLLRIEYEWSLDEIQQILDRCGRYVEHLIIHQVQRNINLIEMIQQYCLIERIHTIEIDLDARLSLRNRTLGNIYEFGVVLLRATSLVKLSISAALSMYRLEFWNLSYNETTTDLSVINAHVIHALPKITIRHFPRVRMLNLVSMKIHFDGVDVGDNAMSDLSNITLINCKMPMAFLDTLSRLEHAETLIMKGNDCQINDLHIEMISNSALQLSHLESKVNLEGSELSSTFWKHVGSIKSLATLVVSCNVAIDLVHLSPLTNLKVLELHHVDGIFADDMLPTFVFILPSLHTMKQCNVPNVCVDVIHEVQDLFVADVRYEFMELSITATSFTNNKTIKDIHFVKVNELLLRVAMAAD